VPDWFPLDGQWFLLAACGVQFVVLVAVLIVYRRQRARFERDRQNSIELVENLSEGIYRSLPDGRQLSANRALVALNGYSSEAEMLAAVTDIAREWYVDPKRRDQFREAMERDGRVEDFVSEVYRHKTRERIWITESARLVRDPHGPHPVYYEGSVRDITETVRRLMLEEQIRKLTESLPIGLFHVRRDKDGVVSVPFLSNGVARISGIPLEEQRARPHAFSELILPEDVAASRRSFEQAERQGTSWDCEFRMRARDGVEKWVRVNAEIERTGDRVDWYGYVVDTTARKLQEMEIETLAFYDPLTGLPNRRRFMARIQQLLAPDGGVVRQSALLFIDLDNFKGLNDSQGHDIGDLLLVQVAERLRACVSASDMVARMGGDEFVVLLEDMPGDMASATRKAIATAHRALAELSREFALGKLRHVGSASIGAVVFKVPGLTADEALKRADIAMYQAKSAGRNGVALFDPASLEAESERFNLIGELRAALEAGDLSLHYQPQVDVEGRVIGAEALLRWPGRGGGVPALRIVALAGQQGLGDALTRYVVDQGLATLAGWARSPDMAHLRLSLNVTLQSFVADGFTAMIRDLVDRHGVDPSRLTLEVTEHDMEQDSDRMLRQMGELKAMGIRLSLDDFGTGYSSLAQLKRLPFDEIKLDGSFIADIEESEGDRALVKTILSMAATLGRKSVAEHVENARQEAFLRIFGCDVLQGNFYSKPLPHEEFEALFVAGTTADRQRQIRLGA